MDTDQISLTGKLAHLRRKREGLENAGIAVETWQIAAKAAVEARTLVAELESQLLQARSRLDAALERESESFEMMQMARKSFANDFPQREDAHQTQMVG